MATFPVGIPYNLQKPRNPYCRDFPYERQHCIPANKLSMQEFI